MALVSAELRAPICPHSSHIVAEVVEAYRKEFAVTLGDVLLRRVPVALGACWSESCSREAALRIGAVLGWNEQDLGSNLESFEMERTAFLKTTLARHFRAGSCRRLTHRLLLELPQSHNQQQNVEEKQRKQHRRRSINAETAEPASRAILRWHTPAD